MYEVVLLDKVDSTFFFPELLLLGRVPATTNWDVFDLHLHLGISCIYVYVCEPIDFRIFYLVRIL
jgi:hypothetical protein